MPVSTHGLPRFATQVADVARLRWLPSARDDLLDILTHVARESGDVELAERFVRKIRMRCQGLSALPATMGRPRPELRPDIRSVAFRGYVIFFRYEGGALEVVNIINGHRDVDAFFSDAE